MSQVKLYRDKDQTTFVKEYLVSQLFNIVPQTPHSFGGNPPSLLYYNLNRQ